MSADLHTADAARVALHTFWRIADDWDLTLLEQCTLLGSSPCRLNLWKTGRVGPLNHDVVLRLSHVFAIHAALQVLLPAPGRADRWLRTSNGAEFLGGTTALQHILGKQMRGLTDVRHYLDQELGDYLAALDSGDKLSAVLAR